MASLNSHNDDIDASGPAPTETIGVVLEDGRPEEEQGYSHSEEYAVDHAWSRNWARWEGYDVFTERDAYTFVEYRREFNDAWYDYAPVEPGPIDVD